MIDNGHKDKLSPPAPAENKDTSLFDKLIYERGYLILFILIVIIGIFVFKDYIFLKSLYLFKDIGSDTLNIGYPQLVHISEYLRTEGIPKWSFNQGMGQNIFPFALGNPFDLILYMLGKDYLAYGIVYVEFLKIILGGIIFYLYLRTVSLTRYASIVGGILFSFSGFMILGGGWYIFSTKAVYGALLLFSFEKLFKEKSWVFFPVPIALIASLQPFDLYLYGVFLFIYTIFRYVDEKGLDIRGFSILLFKMAGLCALGVAISSVFLLSSILQIMESPRISGDASYFGALLSKPVFGFADTTHYITAVMRLFSNDLLGTGSFYRGWSNYLEAPMFYSGLMSLILVPQVFIFLNRRQKILYLIIAGCFILPVIFPFFRYAFWLFSGDYYRGFSFFISLMLLFFSLKALDRIDKSKRINLALLVMTSGLLLGVLYYPYQAAINNLIDNEIRTLTVVFLVVYTVIIYLLGLRKLSSFVKAVLLVLICIELAFFSSITANRRLMMSSNEFNQKVGYNDYTNDAVAFLNHIDKGFYRINKDYSSGTAIHGSLNDAKVQNYKGVSSYHQFNQQYYVKFLHALEILHGNVESETRWIRGLRAHPLLQTFASVKYNLSKSDNPAFTKSGYYIIKRFGDVQILRNKYFLPLGFTYDKYIIDSDFQKLSIPQKDIILLRSFVIADAENREFQGLTRLDLHDIMNNPDFDFHQYGKLVHARSKDVLKIVEYNQNVIKGTISLDKMKLLFFSIPYDRGWSAKVDGKKVQPRLVNIGFIGLLLDKGEHIVELEFHPPYLLAGAVVSSASILLYILLVFISRTRKRRDRKPSLKNV